MNILINNNRPKSTFANLSQIVDNRYVFNIPIYQRLYVWGDGQIKTLLEDLYKGFIDDIEHYYLGGIMVSKNQEDIFDLIDGQQRFTTLWLIGHILENGLSKFNYLEENKVRKPRLVFSIREYANDFFKNPLLIENDNKYSEEEIKELEPINEALKTIIRFIKEKGIEKEKKQQFSKFILEKVLLMVTEMPKNTDENKLFEVLNNRGVQLQHHEILKAKILKFITNVNERSKYAKMWDACSIMEEYIEKNIKEVTGVTWKELTFQSNDDNEKQVDLPKNILDRINETQNINKLNLLEILEPKPEQEQVGENYSDKKDDTDKKFDYDSGKVDSIISFPMLLLHVLRIYQFDKNKGLSNEDIAPVDEKKLLQIFEHSFRPYWELNSKDELSKKEVEENAKEFINLLWEIRLGFDKHIIKWIVKEKNLKVHGIKKLYLNKDALQRRENDGNDGFALLQSMLYHSQQIITHYWLTPLLNKIRNCDDSNELYKYLTRVDNSMFCSEIKEGLSTRSWHLLNDHNLYNTFPNISYLSIDGAKGTDYPSYIFYKLDFILWYYRIEIFKSLNLNNTKKEDWDNYRMTAKNSVEHISPQNRKEYDLNLVWEDTDAEEEKQKKLNDFGNLVLITSSMNSTYSNNIYTTKRSEFLAKANNKRLDSLKSALIFENENWSWKISQEHKEFVKKLINKYLESDHA
jgi:uncharacterized protein with ParB-like and HNH nuclease domain